MNAKIARPLGYLSLLGTIVPSILFMLHKIELAPMQGTMLVSCVVWFAVAPFWIKSD